jgi:hypothetical protein
VSALSRHLSDDHQSPASYCRILKYLLVTGEPCSTSAVQNESTRDVREMVESEGGCFGTHAGQPIAASCRRSTFGPCNEHKVNNHLSSRDQLWRLSALALLQCHASTTVLQVQYTFCTLKTKGRERELDCRVVSVLGNKGIHLKRSLSLDPLRLVNNP